MTHIHRSIASRPSSTPARETRRQRARTSRAPSTGATALWARYGADARECAVRTSRRDVRTSPTRARPRRASTRLVDDARTFARARWTERGRARGETGDTGGECVERVAIFHRRRPLGGARDRPRRRVRRRRRPGSPSFGRRARGGGSGSVEGAGRDYADDVDVGERRDDGGGGASDRAGGDGWDKSVDFVRER